MNLCRGFKSDLETELMNLANETKCELINMKKTFSLNQLGVKADAENWEKSHEAQKALDCELCGEEYYITSISDDKNGDIVVEYELGY